MKILVISDVHSHIHGLRAIEQQEQTWDMVLFAGDMLDYGLQPAEVIGWMREHQVVAVAGNHDIGLVQMIDQGFERLRDPLMAQTFSGHNVSVLTDEDLEYVRQLPLEVTVVCDGVTYFMTHIYDDTDGQALLHHLEQYHSISSFEEYWQTKVGKTQGKRCLVLGDTHHCMMLQIGKDATIINPGAVGYKLGADTATKGATYIVIEDGVPYFRWADYDTREDYETVVNQMTNLEDWQRRTGIAIFQPQE